MFNTLSGRFLMLTVAFVMLAEVLIFVPSIARYREDFLKLRLERAQIAALAMLAADNMIDERVEQELLDSAEIYNVILRRNQMSQLILSSDVPGPVHAMYDLRDAPALTLIRDAIACLMDRENRIIRVLGQPVRGGGEFIEVTMDSAPMRAAMIDYGLRILQLSAVISVITACLLYFAVRRLIVSPIRKVVGAMQLYANAPEDARRIITPGADVREIYEAEAALNTLETQLTSALKQKDRLAQLGEAVAKISHDLRNILTSAQLFADRMEHSQDPLVSRVAPKMLGSLKRAVTLCENTLAFGKAEEPAPRLDHVVLSGMLSEIIEGEKLAADAYPLDFIEDVPATLTLRADSEQLFRVLSNLIRNARQAIIASGEPGQIRIHAGEDDTNWTIEVSDTGPGLPPRARDHLFRPFQGGTRKGGTGLGLAISMELIRGHGGTLSLTRSDETGTAFRITMPKTIAP